MAQGHGKRPDGKAVELPQEKLARQKLEANLDTRTKEANRALEKAQGGGEIDAEVAAQLQKGMGNAALASMVKQGTDTDTATTGAEATLDEAREKEGEEEEQEKETGDLEQELPSFSMGGGGGGGTGGSGGNSPWSMGKYFGGDGDDEGDPAVLGGPRWRPMPIPPDPDEDIEVDRIEEDDEVAPAAEVSLAEADERLGEAPWVPGVLSRGLRHPGRLVGRTAVDPVGQVDPIWSRARAMLRFLAENAPAGNARELASAAAALGVADDTPLVVGLARDLSLLEAALSELAPGWAAVCDIAGDQRARARTEQTAAVLAPEGRLFAPDLLAATLGDSTPPVDVDLGRVAHPAAVTAVSRAARLSELPAISSWVPEVESQVSDEATALERLLDGALGEGDEAPSLHESLGPLYRQLNRLLGALGVIQVEGAAAALAAWPWLADGVAEGVAGELDQTLRSIARRLVEMGRGIEDSAGNDDVEGVVALSSRLSGLASLAELTRLGAIRALAADLLDPEGPKAVQELDPLASLFERGRSDAIRAQIAGRDDLAAVAWRARLDGAPGVLRGGIYEGSTGLISLLVCAADESAHGPCAEGRDLATVQPARPYAVAYVAMLKAFANDGVALLDAAASLREAGHGGPLNLLKAAFVEINLRSGAPSLSG